MKFMYAAPSLHEPFSHVSRSQRPSEAKAARPTSQKQIKIDSPVLCYLNDLHPYCLDSYKTGHSSIASQSLVFQGFVDQNDVPSDFFHLDTILSGVSHILQELGQFS
jgi:hypothetical protein